MPNHVKNVVKFKNLKTKDVVEIVNNFLRPYEDAGRHEKLFDLNSILPEPRTESECPEDCKVNKDSHVMEDKDRPWFDWYTWRNKYWGTKWNTYDGYTKIGTNTITCVFSTAWSTPYEVWKELAHNYPYDFEVRYADEDLGSNCGKIKCEQTASGCNFTHGDYEDNYNFARRLWRDY